MHHLKPALKTWKYEQFFHSLPRFWHVFQSIGLRESLPETMDFPMKHRDFLQTFPFSNPVNFLLQLMLDWKRRPGTARVCDGLRRAGEERIRSGHARVSWGDL